MPSSSVFRWLDGRGWFILAPGSRLDSDVRAQALAVSSADGALACALVNGAGAQGDAMLDELEQLGAPSGYLVDLISEDDETLISRLGEAGIIFVESGASLGAVDSALRGAAEQGIRAAHANGAVVVFEGLSAVLCGRIAVDDKGEVVSGLNWLEDGLIVPTAQNLTALVMPVLQQYPNLYAVGCGPGTALALGPDGQLEVWGSQQVAVTLGKQYGAP